MSDEKIMFRVSKYDCRIASVNVVKITKSFVTYMRKDYFTEQFSERRESRNDFFETWEEARDFLLKRAAENVASARRSLELANSTFGNLKGMKKPDSVG